MAESPLVLTLEALKPIVRILNAGKLKDRGIAGTSYDPLATGSVFGVE